LSAKARGKTPKRPEIPTLESRAFPELSIAPAPNPAPPTTTHAAIATPQTVDEDTAMSTVDETGREEASQTAPPPALIGEDATGRPGSSTQNPRPTTLTPPDGTRGPGASFPSTQFTVMAPRPTSYANALKRTADQVGNDSEGELTDDRSPPEDRENDEGGDHQGFSNPPPGPIKGFDTERIFKNLDPVVRESWESQVDEAVFIHYLSGGYDPNIAQNVHVIAEDLKSEHPLKSLEQIEPRAYQREY